MYLLAAAATEIVDVGQWMGVISQIIGWTFFVVILCIMKNYFAYGLSIAVSEFLIKNINEEKCRKIARWFVNGEQILECLEEIKGKMQSEKSEGS